MATTEISKATIVENIWKNFFDRVKDQVTSVSITGLVTVTVQNYVSSFPDKLIDSKSDYPILVVETPSLGVESFTIGKDKVEGTISLSIYTNQGESADKFLSKIIDSIETYKHSLREAGLSLVKLDSTDTDMVKRDAIKVHMRQATFSFKFHYTKTGAY